MLPLTPDFAAELVTIDLSTRMRWAQALKDAGEPYLAEEVFPDTPAFETELETAERAA